MAETDSQMLPNTVDIQLTRNPFEEGRVHSYAFEGETIEHMIVSRGLRLDDTYGILVAVGGELVPERMFSKVKPKAGVSVIIKVIPRGGRTGKAIFSIVVGVLAIASAWATGGGSLWLGLDAAEKFGVAALAFTGAMTIASGIQSLVAPPPSVPFSGNVPQSQDSAALTGTRNTARLYGPIRTVLGKYRVYPDLLGKPFQERVGKDSVLRLLMCFGYGPLLIEDVKIGETPIDEVGDVRYNVLQGWSDDAELSIFRDEVDADSSFQKKLDRVSPVTQTLTTGSGPEEISIDIAFPAGLISFDDDGKPRQVTVRIDIKEREQGVGSFTAIGTPTRGLESSTGIRQVSAGVFDIKLKERGSITRGLRWTVPSGSTANAFHEVQIQRISTTAPDWNDQEAAISADAVITTIRTIKPHIGSTIPNLAKIELEINASETGLSGVIDNLSAICTSIVPEYDNVENEWGPVVATSDAYGSSMHASRNPAWLFAHALRGPANSRPIDDSRIDGPGLAVWAGNLQGPGGQSPIGGYEPDGVTALARNIDAVVDFTTTARKLVSDIAAAGRASLNIIDGKYSVVQDIPKTQVIQHFTPRNSSGFSGSKAFRKAPHAVRVHFVNPAITEDNKSYQKDELIVYNDGYSENGNPAVALEFRGSTTPTSIIEGNASGSGAAWSTQNALVAGYQGYAVRHTINSTDPGFYNVGGTGSVQLNIDTTASNPNAPLFVRMRLRRVTKGDEAWDGKMYFMLGGAGRSETKRQFATEPDWTKGWVTVVWDMTTPDAGTWTGNADIGRLRFNLTTGGTSFGSVFDIESVTIDDGTQAATEFGELSLWGVSDARQAYRDGRYHLASTKLRPEIFSLTTDVEHLVCSRGDLVRVSHDCIGVGYGAARLKSAVHGGGSFISGVLDQEFHYEPGKNYAMRVRGFTDGGEPADAVLNLINLGTISADVVPDINFQWSITGFVKPDAGDLVMFGERETESIECIVKSISPRNDLTATIELVEYNAAVYETGEIPDHNSNITLESSPALLRPIKPTIVGELISDETAAEFSASGTPTVRIIMNVSTPQSTIGTYAPTTHYHPQFRLKDGDDALTDWINSPRVEAIGETQVSIIPVDQDEVYDIRVRAISDSAASSSDWEYRNNHTVIGLSTPPPAPTSLSVWGTAIRWDYGNKPRDFAGFIVKHQGGDDATWATGIPITTNLITDNWIQINGRIQYGTTTIMVRAVDMAGNESDTLSAVKLIRTPEQLDDIKTETWTGVWGSADSRINCTIEAGTNHLIADVESSGLFWRPISAAPFWVTSGHVFWSTTTIYEEMSFLGRVETSHDFADIAGANWPVDADFPCREYVSQLDTQGADYKIEYRPYQYIDVMSAGATITGTGGSSTATSSRLAGSTSILIQDGDRAKFPDASSISITLADNTTFTTTVAQSSAASPVYDIIILDAGLPDIQGAVTYFPGVDWAPWPGERILDEPEFPILDAGSDVERLLIRFTIAGGPVQGKLKAAEFKIEGIKKTHREILTVGISGTVVDLTGRGFRKITSISATPANSADLTQSGVTCEAFDLLAKHQPDGGGTAYELSGPTILMHNHSNATIEADASVTIEGY